jgi:hypothetical protein
MEKAGQNKDDKIENLREKKTIGHGKSEVPKMQCPF